MLSSLEITENEYLIRLPRGEFQISFISQLLREIKRTQLESDPISTQDFDSLAERFTNRDAVLRFDDLRDK